MREAERCWHVASSCRLAVLQEDVKCQGEQMLREMVLMMAHIAGSDQVDGAGEHHRPQVQLGKRRVVVWGDGVGGIQLRGAAVQEDEGR